MIIILNYTELHRYNIKFIFYTVSIILINFSSGHKIIVIVIYSFKVKTFNS